MVRLDSISISGFKSIGSRQQLELGDVTICLGANGAGKSNLISFFKMLNYMTTDGLQNYIGKNGMANAILHFGPAVTKTISFELHFSEEDWKDTYKAGLTFGMPDSLFISGEHITAHKKGHDHPIESDLQSAGRGESALNGDSFENDGVRRTCRVLKSMLSKCKVYQFHDTSESSRLRNSCYIENGRFLMSDAGNLPAFLYAMKSKEPKYYQRIVEHIRIMVPQFQDFVLEPSVNNQQNILLNWIGERGREYLFGPHQLSDGSLRYMALTALLLQPKETLPNMIVLDEPELGLHPAAIKALAGMISIAKRNCQILLATQSPKLANQFSADDIVVVNYDKTRNESSFARLDPQKLGEWLQNYTIEELWDKNVIGGRP